MKDRISELRAENAALQKRLAGIEAQASDATEYVLAQINVELRAENAALRERFAHYHRDSGVPGNDSCKECGFDLRNPIHTRAAWAEEQK